MIIYVAPVVAVAAGALLLAEPVGWPTGIGRTEVAVQVRTVTTENLAETPAFGGSPTILLDGVDPFADVAAGPAGVSCRIYRMGATSAGVPSLAQVRDALGSGEAGSSRAR